MIFLDWYIYKKQTRTLSSVKPEKIITYNAGELIKGLYGTMGSYESISNFKNVYNAFN